MRAATITREITYALQHKGDEVKEAILGNAVFMEAKQTAILLQGEAAADARVMLLLHCMQSPHVCGAAAQLVRCIT